MSPGAVRQELLGDSASAWARARELARRWMRSGRGDGLIVADRIDDAATLARECGAARLHAASFEQITLTAVRRGALTAGLPPGFLVLEAAAIEVSSERADRRWLSRHLAGSVPADDPAETGTGFTGMSELLAHPRWAARVSRARTSARIARATASRADLERAARRIDRKHPDLWGQVVGEPGTVIVVAGGATAARWLPRIEVLARREPPPPVWFLETAAGAGAPSMSDQPPAVEELSSLAAALEDPRDALAVAATLRSRLFGLSDDVLQRHRQAGGSWIPRRCTQPSSQPGDPAVLEALDQLDRWSERLRRAGPGPTLEAAIREIGQLELLSGLSGDAREALALRRRLDALHEVEVRTPGDARPVAELIASREPAWEAELRRSPVPGSAPGWPSVESGSRTEVVDLQPPAATGRTPIVAEDFELRVARHAIERLSVEGSDDDPGAVAAVVEQILALTGRGQEDAVRAVGVVRGVWEHPLLDRARRAPVSRSSICVSWLERGDPGRDNVEAGRLVRGMIDLWLEDDRGRAIVICDGGAWGDGAGRDRRIAARSGETSRLARRLEGSRPIDEAWLLLVGGPQVEAHLVP